MSEHQFQIWLVILATAFGALPAWYFFCRQKRDDIENKNMAKDRASRDRLAEHLEAMAEHLENMAVSFAKQEIPHASGRAFEGLYKQLFTLFPQVNLPVQDELVTLQRLIDRAGAFDRSLYETPKGHSLTQEVQEAMQEWSITAHRLQGDLSVAAAGIRNSEEVAIELQPESKVS